MANQTQKQKKEFSSLTKFSMVFGAVALSVLLFMGVQAFSETRIGLTLFSNPDLEDGLVGHWSFDGADMVSNVADRSGQGNDGALQGQTSTTTAIGVIGQAFELDGSDDYVEVADHASIQDIFDGGGTVAVWIKPDTTGDGGFGRIAQKGTTDSNGWSLYIDNVTSGGDGNFNFRQDHGSAGDRAAWETDNFPFTFGQWAHVVVVHDSSSVSNDPTIYVNGVSVAHSQLSIASSAFDSDAGDPLFIGIRSGSDRAFDGGLDDFRLYDRALSVGEISRLYDLGATTHINTTLRSREEGQAENLVGHWSFDGPDMISNVADRSGQGNHGALQGQTSTTTAIGVIGQALDFDGSDDYVDMGDTLDSVIAGADKKFSMSAWVKSNSISSSQTIISKYNSDTNNRGIMFRIFGSKITFHFEDLAISDRRRIDGSTTLSSDTWYHFVVTYDGSQDGNNGLDRVKLYVDAVRETETLASSEGSLIDIQDGSADLNIGALVTGGSHAQFFDGIIDDVRVYDRALSESEVQRLYDLGR